jgi:putative phosphoesterase
MQIGILSDSHGHAGNLKKALDVCRENGITTIVHCGDLATASMVRQFVGFDVIYVFGNVDDSHDEIEHTLVMQNANNSADLVYTGTIGGVSVAATHGHLRGKVEELVRSKSYRYVFTGHTHRRLDNTIKRTRIINPGALGGTRYQDRSICLLDLETDIVEFVTIAKW